MVLAAMMVTSCGNGLNEACCDRQPPSYRTFPSFLEEESYDVATLATTVNHYVSLGEAAALADLRKRAAKSERDPLSSNETRIGHVAHILWGSSGVALRNRADGAYMDLPYLSMPASAWPHYPMVRSGQSFFVMSEFRILAGVAEPLSDYLSYCQKNGRFRREALPVPTHDQAVRDLNALQASWRWR
ncbi:MAG TPA: hypothetical protein VGE67_15115, partial [Haloferula sp.]